MNTCVSLGCPFTHVCKHYNYLMDRGEKCETQTEIVKQAERLKKQERAKKRYMTEIPGES